MNPDFAPLLEYLERRFGRIEARLDPLREEVSSLHAGVDSYARRADASFQGRA